MANKLKGQITALLDGKEYTIALDMNVIAEVEDALDLSWSIVEGRIAAGTGRISDLRRVVFHGLKRFHKDATLELAGDLLSEDPEVFGRLFEASMPKPEAAADGDQGNGEAAA